MKQSHQWLNTIVAYPYIYNPKLRKKYTVYWSRTS